MNDVSAEFPPLWRDACVNAHAIRLKRTRDKAPGVLRSQLIGLNCQARFVLQAIEFLLQRKNPFTEFVENADSFSTYTNLSGRQSC